MRTNSFQILLIDDDEDEFVFMRDLCREITRSQYQLTWKASFQTGLEALRTQSYDACLLDHRLGAETGLELLQAISKEGLRCPTILLTGQGDFEIDVQAMQTGASDYLVKSQLTAPLLERTIRYAIKHALDKDELRENKAQILQQDRLASLGLLASSLAHEIGTPLGIIRSRAEMAQKKQLDAERLKSDMGIIVSQIDRITKLVNSLLNLARGQQSDSSAAVDLNFAIEDVLNLFKHELDRNGIELKIVNETNPQVRAEQGPLSQVLLNLMVNSLHAIKDAIQSGRTMNHSISLTVSEFPESVEIYLRDSGIGIPQKNLSQLFKPFFTTKDIGLGTGLGLATSFNLVNSWGGTIKAENNADFGAKFTIRLQKIKN